MDMHKYPNRYAAGKQLAEYLLSYQQDSHAIVLALPRGGVPVAYEIAVLLRLPLDIFVVRKLGLPSYSELAMGAIASGEVIVFNDRVMREYSVSNADLQKVIAQEKKELHRRESVYRGGKVFPDLKNKNIILVDDGIATGATVRAAISALRQLQPAKIIVAVPVAPIEEAQQIKILVDEWVCPLVVSNFDAVGAWYEDFSQTEDNEVHQLLAAIEKRDY
jgi:putative phosphoribosyl transferase